MSQWLWWILMGGWRNENKDEFVFELKMRRDGLLI